MNNIINGVWDICDKFIVDGRGKHVVINELGIEKVAENIKNNLSEGKECWLGYPDCFDDNTKDVDYKAFFYELLAASVNYQYWYGRYDVRPNGACADEMYKLLDEAFSFAESRYGNNRNWGYICQEVCGSFIEYLSIARFPNIKNRIKHINQIFNLFILGRSTSIFYIVKRMTKKNQESMTVNEFITSIISRLPGYAEDMFLKRVFLLSIMLYRRFQWFKDDIATVPVPADYQLPKMLEALGCISYGYIISEKIQAGELIIAGSLEECEIRAATILVCKKLSELSGHKMCDIDTYLWLKRKEVDKPFHLTITTDY